MKSSNFYTKYTNIIDNVISGFVVAVLFTVICITWIVSLKYGALSIDPGWNSNVVCNFAKSGEYYTTWPVEQPFFRWISTGQTVLVPSAMVVRLFGVSFESFIVVPLIYFSLFVLFLYRFIYLMLNSIFSEHVRIKRYNKLFALFIWILLFVEMNYCSSFSSELLGEGAALFFIVVSFIALYYFLANKKTYSLAIVGGGFAAAILTKAVTLCCCTVILVALFWLILKNPDFNEKGKFVRRNIFSLAGGFL